MTSIFFPRISSRLVIDPYREECRMQTAIGAVMQLEIPFLVGGFDHAPKQIKNGLGQALATNGCAYLGERPLPPRTPVDATAGTWRRSL